MDDIWDDDAVEFARTTPKTTANAVSSRSRVLRSDSEDDNTATSSRPSKRARTDKPLFNPDSDEDDMNGSASNKDNVLPPDIDALFDGLDDDDYTMGLPPQLDIEQLQREADKRAAIEANKRRMLRGETDVLGETVDGGGADKSGTGKKSAGTKRVIPKLDEQRLLDRDGLPALVRRAKELNIKGKGHELSDLNRLMQMYQLWAHKMFPKMQFHDTVERVERLCRSKRMHVALSTWRDIENAPVPGDVEADDNIDEEDHQAEAQHPPTSSPARITLEPGGPPVRQSQAHPEPDEDEEEMWRDMMDTMESQNQAKQKDAEPTPSVPSRKEPEDRFDAYDEEDWAIMDEMEQRGESSRPSNGKSPAVQPPAGPKATPPPDLDHEVSSDVPPDPVGPSEDEEDDFYAIYEP